MCGIAAVLSPSGALRAATLRALGDAVRHRGPDDEGIVLFAGARATPSVFAGNDTPPGCFGDALPYLPKALLGERIAPDAFAALSHRRLSIIDLSSAGHQPMCSPDQRSWLVFNGEIYNYIELRRELEAAGVRFRTRTDTEVLLAAYDHWGLAGLHRLNGMFAFVLIDRRERRLIAVRDRFGIKPLYYWIAPGGEVVFASEIKQFCSFPGWKARINGQRAYDFLNWAILDHTEETLFAGVHQIRNGELVELALDALPPMWPGGRLPARRWYELRGAPFQGSADEAAHAFRALMEEAVASHLRADVPIGSCLSGGLDSSTIVCLMSGLLRRQHAQAQQRAFSACTDVRPLDERAFIEQVVSHTGVSSLYVYPDAAELFAVLERLIWHQDEPFASTSIFAQWKVFELAARSGVKVMLDGQGADEQLAGYEAFQAARLAGLFRSLRWGLLWSEMQALKRVHGRGEWWSAKRVLDGVLPGRVRGAARRWAGKASAEPDWLDLGALGAIPADPFPAIRAGGDDAVTALSLEQLTRSNLQMLLHWEDRDSMAHSIEARVPFLDHRVVEFVVGLPDEFKLSQGMTKRVLREAMRGVLPEGVRTRTDKLGFVTPEEVWIRKDAPSRFEREVREAVASSRGILKPEAIGHAERVIRGDAAFSRIVWQLVAFGAWMRRFNVAPS